jgi:hypothetical protein
MLISNQWLPFYALYLLRLDRGRWRDAVMLGLFMVFTAWTELTYIPFLALLTIFYLVYLAISRRAALLPFVKNIAIAAVFTAVCILPLVLSLAADFQQYGYYLASGLGRIQIFSAEPISFFLPSGQHPILGAWSESITTANTSYAFIGWAVLALVIIGIYVQRASSFARFWAVSALLFALLMLGSTLYLSGTNTNIPMPFALLRLLPFVNANRYPARFNVMLMLALLPLFAWGILALWSSHRTFAKFALAALLVLFVFEQLVLPIPLTHIQPPAVFHQLRDEPGDFTILELPLGWRGSIVMQGETDDVAQFFQTADHARRLGGITSRFPDFKLRYFDDAPVLRALIAHEEGRTLDPTRQDLDRAEIENVLRFFNIRYVSVYLPQIAPETYKFVQEYFPLQQIYADSERVLYRVNLPPPAPSQFTDPASDSARLSFDETWGNPQSDDAGFGYRWATTADTRVWLPLENSDYETTFRLRGALPSQNIKLAVNGHPVTEWNITGDWQEYSAHIPKSLTRDGLDELVFTTQPVPLAVANPSDRTLGGTGITSPVDISATGAGFDAGRYGEIYVAGKNAIPSTRGYHLVAVNPQMGTLDAVGSFDTFASDTASTRLVEFVETLPQREIVVGVAVDDASQKLTPEAFAALQSLGVAGDVRSQFRAGHAFVGIKGSSPGSAVEDLVVSVPATVAIGKAVTRPQVTFALGPFTYERLEPR